mmetsp:Transcript_19706/g.19806  ORF Transcript_19706/g.19806 Transcript_19706/m.19806 type:complete len:409 (+) Transcript_19706:119-1345(+)|eukprot:CAMPEP_0182429584 /NCGR_PEP_ID=MMETSP1167-20130531/31198_1 /TAXON_ID=2988 /ORGANISM="Mallomonas Sp, Strain CCMP3275" /LENGTH=408 /DNA_ID=CAMNT_0024613465 /DNA_START=18 /DNA_END=1244 /DNA_ORIENTATION=+
MKDAVPAVAAPKTTSKAVLANNSGKAKSRPPESKTSAINSQIKSNAQSTTARANFHAKPIPPPANPIGKNVRKFGRRTDSKAESKPTSPKVSASSKQAASPRKKVTSASAKPIETKAIEAKPNTVEPANSKPTSSSNSEVVADSKDIPASEPKPPAAIPSPRKVGAKHSKDKINTPSSAPAVPSSGNNKIKQKNVESKSSTEKVAVSSPVTVAAAGSVDEAVSESQTKATLTEVEPLSAQTTPIFSPGPASAPVVHDDNIQKDEAARKIQGFQKRRSSKTSSDSKPSTSSASVTDASDNKEIIPVSSANMSVASTETIKDQKESTKTIERFHTTNEKLKSKEDEVTSDVSSAPPPPPTTTTTAAASSIHDEFAEREAAAKKIQALRKKKFTTRAPPVSVSTAPVAEHA